MTRRLKRIGAILGALFIAVAMYAWFFGTVTMLIWQTRSFARSSPIINVVPVPLPDNSISQAAGSKRLIGGYEFEIPWNDVPEKPLSSTRKILTLQTGSVVMVNTAPPRSFVNTVLGNNGTNEKSIQNIYGPDVLQSDYSLTKYMLHTTPSQIHLGTPKRDAIACSMMLIFKGIAIPQPAESGLYSIQTPEFAGFQYGDPSKRSKRIVVDLFSEDGGLEFMFMSKDEQSLISQADINRVVQSVRKMSADDVKPKSRYSSRTDPR